MSRPLLVRKYLSRDGLSAIETNEKNTSNDTFFYEGRTQDQRNSNSSEDVTTRVL